MMDVERIYFVMLKILPVQNVTEKREILKSLNSQTDSLLVSDLRAKFEWQSHYLEKDEVIAEEFIFRPSDMWKKFSSYLLPDFQIVSNEYIISYISTYLQSKTEEFLKTPSAAQSLFSYLGQLSVVFEHPEGRELLKEWFKENVDSFHRWGHWFFVAEELWTHFSEKKIISSSWVPALLLGKEDLLAQFWQRPIYLDLSLELKYVEAELFSELSKYLDLYVLFPRIDENSEYKLDFETYRPFAAKLNDSFNFDSLLESQDKKYQRKELESVKRFSSSLSEVKDSVASLRELLDSGVAPEEIAIIACDIGEYWPVLRPYLEKEGVPCQRPYNSGVQSLLPVSTWLSEISVASKNWQREDLELSLYREEEPNFSYDNFLRFYTKIYDSNDLSRKKEVYGKYKSSLKDNELISRDDFIVWALSLWKSKHYPSVLEHLIKTVIAESPNGIKLFLRDWIQYIAKLCSKQEVCIRPGDPKGVLCVDLSSLEYIDCKHVFILGMSEDSFKRNSPLKAVSQQDMLSLRTQTGFPLSPEESRSFEYYLLWNLRNENRNYYFSFAVTDLKGNIGAPSLVWLKEKKKQEGKHDAIDSPKLSRLDQLQTQSLEYLADETNLGFNIEALKRDLGKEIHSPKKLERFSPTGFKDYVQCPFKFAARYFFELRKLPPVDLDMDRMKNGSIIHKLFELAVERKIAAGEDQRVSELVMEVLDSQGDELGEEKLKARYVFQYEKILNRFLEFEASWRKEFPNTKYWKQEYEVDVFWNKDKGKFQNEKGSGPRFRGIVDRIDKFENQLCLIDYKNSGSAYKNFSSWFADDDYQLLFYTKIMQDLFSKEESDVMAAVYYSLKPWGRSKGFIRKDADPGFVPSSDRKKNKVEEGDLLEASELLSKMINKFYEDVEEGKLSPDPKDPQEHCGQCDWKTICRAKHLNS